MFDSVNTVPKRTTGWYVKVAVAVLVALVVVIAILGSWYTVDEKERGVVLRNKAFYGVVTPGLHFKMPFVDSVVMISTQDYSTVFETLQAYSADQQPAKMKASVNWHIDPTRVSEVYASSGSVDVLAQRTIDRYVPTALENTFGQYNAVNAVQKRPQLVIDYGKTLRAMINGPIIIDSVQLENIDFSDDYEKSIAARMKAEVAVATRKQDLDKEKVDAEIAVTQAQGQADSNLAKARADAEATKLRGEADAYAIKVKSDALAANPALVELTKAERWNGQLPTTMLPNAAIPFIDAKK